MKFTFKLEHANGTPADPPTIRSAPGVSWRPGDTVPLGGGEQIGLVRRHARNSG